MLQKSRIDSNATVATICKSLGKLDEHMAKCGQNVVAFNTHVNGFIEGLRACGKTSTDLLTNSFVGHLACSDQEFVTCIKDKETKHEEGEDLTHGELMLLATNKHKICKMQNKWNAPSEQEEKILPLQSKVKDLKKVKFQKRNNVKGKCCKKQARKPLPEWMMKKPAQADLTKPKMADEKKCHWCSSETRGKCEGA